MCLEVALSLHERVSRGLLQVLVHPPPPFCPFWHGSWLSPSQAHHPPYRGTDISHCCLGTDTQWHLGLSRLPRSACKKTVPAVEHVALQGGGSATARSILLPLPSSAPSRQGALGWRIPATTANTLPTFLAVSTIVQHPQPQKVSAASGQGL